MVGREGDHGRGGWTRDRLRAALAEHGGTTHTARATALDGLVGAVFTHGADGDHFCTPAWSTALGRT